MSRRQTSDTPRTVWAVMAAILVGVIGAVLGALGQQVSSDHIVWLPVVLAGGGAFVTSAPLLISFLNMLPNGGNANRVSDLNRRANLIAARRLAKHGGPH